MKDKRAYMVQESDVGHPFMISEWFDLFQKPLTLRQAKRFVIKNNSNSFYNNLRIVRRGLK